LTSETANESSHAGLPRQKLKNGPGPFLEAQAYAVLMSLILQQKPNTLFTTKSGILGLVHTQDVKRDDLGQQTLNSNSTPASDFVKAAHGQCCITTARLPLNKADV
jgi:hypothetical protein